MSWVSEFGREYKVPAAFVRLGDHSWHNDTCPSFGVVDDDNDLRVWVEHPDVDCREHSSGARFCVVLDDEVLYEGDDPGEALAAFGDALATRLLRA